MSQARFLPSQERRRRPRREDVGDGGGLVAHGGPEGNEETALAGSDDGGGEYDGGLSEPPLHGGDGAGVAGRGVVGEGDNRRARSGGEGLEHAEDGGDLRAVHRGEILDLVDDQEGGASGLNVVGEASHDVV